MDPSPVCCECTVHHMGQTEHRPVRYTPEPPASGVRVSHGRSTSSGCRRIINSMEGNVCLCIPPFVMLGRVLEKVQQDHPCEMILIAPKWPNQSWYARLMELLVDFPLALPLRKDLLAQPHNQPHNHQRHRSLQAVSLHAWRLSSDPSKHEAFRRQLPCPGVCSATSRLPGLSL